MADRGWIKLYRDIQDNEIWKSEEPFSKRDAWIDLILMANHKDNEILFNGNVIIVKRGQLVTSEMKLANRWHWSKDKTRRYIKLLEKLGMLTKESTTTHTTINIVNYCKFQTERTSHNTTGNTTRNTTGNTTDDTQTRIYKNERRMKEEIRSASQSDSDDDYVSEEEWQRRLAEQDDDW